MPVPSRFIGEPPWAAEERSKRLLDYQASLERARMDHEAELVNARMRDALEAQRTATLYESLPPITTSITSRSPNLPEDYPDLNAPTSPGMGVSMGQAMGKGVSMGAPSSSNLDTMRQRALDLFDTLPKEDQLKVLGFSFDKPIWELSPDELKTRLHAQALAANPNLTFTPEEITKLGTLAKARTEAGMTSWDKRMREAKVKTAELEPELAKKQLALKMLAFEEAKKVNNAQLSIAANKYMQVTNIAEVKASQDMYKQFATNVARFVSDATRPGVTQDQYLSQLNNISASSIGQMQALGDSPYAMAIGATLARLYGEYADGLSLSGGTAGQAEALLQNSIKELNIILGHLSDINKPYAAMLYKGEIAPKLQDAIKNITGKDMTVEEYFGTMGGK